MRVLLFPAQPEGQAGNPYLDLLANSLEERGVVVERSAATSHSDIARLAHSRPDVLHLHWLDAVYLTAKRDSVAWLKTRAFVRRLAAIKRQGTRIVWTVHQFESHDRVRPRLEVRCIQAVVEHADAILVHSEVVRAEFLRRYPGAPVQVVPHATYQGAYPDDISRDDARRELGLGSDSFVFLFLGRIEEYKGVVELADAFGTIDAPDAHLLIAGNPRSEDLAQRLVSALPSNASWERGHIPDGRLQVFLRAADVAVLPYRYISTSGAAVLTMDFGLPAVAPALGCFAEAFGSEGAVLYDGDGLAGALEEAINRRDDLPAMGARNRERSAAWTWERVGELTHEAYRNAMCESVATPMDAIRPGSSSNT